MSKLDRLLLLKTRFLNAENPSPTKLSAAFAQVEAALDTIEYAIGNGLDTFVQSNTDRLILPNLSSAIGQGSNIYQPVNEFASLSDVLKSIATGAVMSNSSTLSVTSSAVITLKPALYARKLLAYQLGKWQTVQDVAIGAPSVTIGPGDWKEIALVNASDWRVVAPKDDKMPESYNRAVAIPLSNTYFWAVRIPCSRVDVCTYKTCAYCIGNTYDANGIPTCTASPAYAVSSASVKTIQSCLLRNKDNPHQILNAPFGFKVTGSTGAKCPDGSLYVYNIATNAKSTLYDIPIYKADEFRQDIFITKGNNTITSSETIVSTNYLLVGGNYGLSNQIVDFHKILLSKL